MNINLIPFPVLHTSRLVLRQLTMNDDNELMQLRADDEVNRYLGRPKCTGIEDARNFIQKINALVADQKSVYWAISLTDDPALIGTICLWNLDFEKETVEIGYELIPAYQGKGLMQEAVEKVIAYAFGAINARVITAFPHVNNEASVRLLKRNGFKCDEKGIYADDEDAEELCAYFLCK
jgi:[ribosomal protein S5]-alanine N-acetyltransferase